MQQPHYEINIVYAVEIDDLSIDRAPIAQDHNRHCFEWIPLEKLEGIKLLPQRLKNIIHGHLHNHAPDFFTEFTAATTG